MGFSHIRCVLVLWLDSDRMGNDAVELRENGVSRSKSRFHGYSHYGDLVVFMISSLSITRYSEVVTNRYLCTTIRRLLCRQYRGVNVLSNNRFKLSGGPRRQT